MPAVVSAICVEAPAYFQAPQADTSAKEVIHELVHDLRQPLSAIEAIAYYIEMTLPPDQSQAQYQMRRLQELVVQAECILNSAASSVRKPAASASASS